MRPRRKDSSAGAKPKDNSEARSHVWPARLPTHFSEEAFFGVNGVALAHRLLWRRSPALFWLTSTRIVIVVGYLIATGAAEVIVRFLWPVPFDPVKTKEFEHYAPCQTPRMLGLFLII